ncbi:MAG: hypothetical protein R6W06_06370 [Prochlorococcaceae cyanobacterium]
MAPNFKEDLNEPLKLGVMASLIAALAVVALLRPFLPVLLLVVLGLLIFVLALLVAVEISVYPD